VLVAIRPVLRRILARDTPLACSFMRYDDAAVLAEPGLNGADFSGEAVHFADGTEAVVVGLGEVCLDELAQERRNCVDAWCSGGRRACRKHRSFFSAAARYPSR
jgi:hypothetical protein